MASYMGTTHDPDTGYDMAADQLTAMLEAEQEAKESEAFTALAEIVDGLGLPWVISCVGRIARRQEREDRERRVWSAIRKELA